MANVRTRQADASNQSALLPAGVSLPLGGEEATGLNRTKGAKNDSDKGY